MKIPRQLSGTDLVRALEKIGYVITRKKGSHIRLTCLKNGEHHLTVPDHDPIKIGTLSAILRDICEHRAIDREELLHEMFG